ncbi:vesicle-associated membrane protein 5, isoform CRA_a [Rattus norvegicus]|uniref:Vesicle-associated membrane protein 5, isoform CRA_a n=1 Tax=Rattus norvegicus TaxID=10116 RepID=A6IAB6_RAT|nr:vesicle-associated membrane protein 5, isoform CRA_a [Rattus norvegicus]
MPAAGRPSDGNHAQQFRQGPGTRWEAVRVAAALRPAPGHEFCLQQDNQDFSPAEALGEYPVPGLPGASRGWRPSPHPGCASGHLSSEWRGQ